MQCSSSLRRALASLSLAAAAVVVAPASLAQAAPIAVTDVEISINPTTISLSGSGNVTTEFSGCIPNDAAVGDTIELTLPEQLVDFPSGFSILAGATTVLTATISASVPAVATFTLTSDGDAVNNLCFTSFFGGDWDGNEAGTFELDYEVNAIPFADPPELTVVAGPTGTPQDAFTKTSFFSTNQQCRTETEGCLIWFFLLPVGDVGMITLTDEAQPGWTFDCTGAGFRLATYPNAPAAGPIIYGPRQSIQGDVTWTCTPELLEVQIDTSNLSSTEAWRFDVAATADTPGEAGGVTYFNDASAVVNGDPQSSSNSIRSSFVGGLAQGDLITIEKTDGDGNDADTEADAVLVDGPTTLTFSIVNGGTTELNDVVVSDTIVTGSATVTDFDCLFPDGSNGTTWAGPFESGTQFFCSAVLDGVVETHQNTATVTATGNGPVDDTDPFFAVAPEPVIPDTTVPETTVPETTVPDTTVPETTVPETTVPETTVPDTTVPDTTVPDTTVPETTVPPTTTLPPPPPTELPATGSGSSTWMLLMAAVSMGLGVVLLTARRRGPASI